MCHIVGKKIIQTYHYEIFVKWRRETSIVSWIITLLSEYCWKFSPKQMHMHNYNFCSPACYHCSCQSKKKWAQYLQQSHISGLHVVQCLTLFSSGYLSSTKQTACSFHNLAIFRSWQCSERATYSQDVLVIITNSSSFFCIFRASQLITEWSTW